MLEPAYRPAYRWVMAAAKEPHPLADSSDVFDAVHRHAVKRRVILMPAARISRIEKEF